jgi:hypothetical protein
VLAPTSEEVLTLITCYPFRVLGHAPDRFIVRAVRVADRSTPIEAWSLPLLDWTNGPTLERVATSTAISTPIVVSRDDESVIRDAVKRYLLARSVRPGTCQVTISGDRAMTECESVAHTSAESAGRLFMLERSNDGWAIKSIELK